MSFYQGHVLLFSIISLMMTDLLLPATLRTCSCSDSDPLTHGRQQLSKLTRLKSPQYGFAKLAQLSDNPLWCLKTQARRMLFLLKAACPACSFRNSESPLPLTQRGGMTPDRDSPQRSPQGIELLQADKQVGSFAKQPARYIRSSFTSSLQTTVFFPFSIQGRTLTSTRPFSPNSLACSPQRPQPPPLLCRSFCWLTPATSHSPCRCSRPPCPRRRGAPAASSPPSARWSVSPLRVRWSSAAAAAPF